MSKPHLEGTWVHANPKRYVGTDDVKIAELVKLLQEDKLLIPTFQREFVWESANILKLWEQMLRDQEGDLWLLHSGRGGCWTLRCPCGIVQSIYTSLALRRVPWAGAKKW